LSRRKAVAVGKEHRRVPEVVGVIAMPRAGSSPVRGATGSPRCSACQFAGSVAHLFAMAFLADVSDVPALVVGRCLRPVADGHGMLVGARLRGVHHARAHRSSVTRAGQSMSSAADRGVDRERLIELAPVLVAVDDTLLHRLGRKIHGVFWHHDATANSDKDAVRGAITGCDRRGRAPTVLERAVCYPLVPALATKRKHIRQEPDPERPPSQSCKEIPTCSPRACRARSTSSVTPRMPPRVACLPLVTMTRACAPTA